MKKHLARTIFPVLFILVLLGTAFAFSAHADENDPSLAEALISPTIWLLNAILYIVRAVLAGILALAAFFLNKLFWFNVMHVPTSIQAVPIVWAALRDLTNGAFLLIILWIAFTIILNLDQWGGKRLLFRVIMVALFINFSLLMVTIVFGIANQIGFIFAKNMPPDIGAFIMKSIDAENIGTAITPERLAELKAEEERKVLETQRQFAEASTKSPRGPITDTFLASVGVQTADAASVAGSVLACGGGILVGVALIPFTGGFSVAGAAALCGGGVALEYFTGWGTQLISGGSAVAVRLSGQIFFMLITIVTMFLGAITLLIRYAVMIVLSVLAPLAFLAAMVPKMQKYFDLWLSTMLRWAFFLPMFYLMMYLSFLVISGIDVSATNGAGPTSVDRMIIVFVAILFMWMGLRIARQTGGAIAEAGVGLVAKAGLIAAGGVGALALKGGAAAMAARPEQAQQFAQGLRRVPIFGRKMEAGVMGLGKARKEDIETRMKEVDHYSSEDVAKRYKGAVSSREKAAMAAVLAKRKEMDKHLNETERKEAVKHAERFGVAKDIYKTNPHLIEKDNVDERIKEKRKVLRDADKLGLAPEAYDNDEVIMGIIANIKGRKEVRKIAEEAPVVYKRIQDVMRTRQQQLKNIADEIDRDSPVRKEGSAALQAFEEYELHLANEMERKERRGRANERRREQGERRERERAAEARVNPTDFIT